MTIVSDALATLDEARALLDEVGLRPYDVAIRTITWTGSRPNEGTKTVVTTPLTVASGGAPKVRILANKNVVAGGLYSNTRYEIGPFTPEYEGGGIATNSLDPPATATAREVYYILKGPGLPSSGMLCKKVSDDYSSPFRLMVTVESLGRPAELPTP